MARVAKLLRLTLVPFAILCVIILRLLKGRIRIGVMQTNRIGHLVGNIEVHLCERDAGFRKGVDIWCAPGKVCNKQLLKMWSRVLHLDPTCFTEIVWKVNRLFNGWQIAEIASGNLDRDVLNLYEKYPPHLKFTEAEELLGIKELIELGIPPGSKWVCLIVRDSTYLPHLPYHAHRDSDIDTYTEAVRMLSNRGYYVIRMGAKVAKAMPFTNSKIIDYATNGMRSDFMDIYLLAKCEFAFTNGNGLDSVTSAFRRPICYVNFAPLEYLSTWNPAIAIWKHHMKDGKRMTPAEIWASGAGQFMRAEEYIEAGITLVDNTPEELKTVAEEMAIYVAGFETIGSTYWDQQDFWRDFPRSISPYTRTPLHGEIRMRIGSEFLRGYACE